MGDPWTWADLVPEDVTNPETFLVQVVDEIVEPLNSGDWTDLGEQVLLLAAAAQDAARGHSRRAAAVPNIQISPEEGLRKRNLGSLDGQEIRSYSNWPRWSAGLPSGWAAGFAAGRSPLTTSAPRPRQPRGRAGAGR